MIEGRRRALPVRDDSILVHWEGLRAHLHKHLPFIRTRERIRRGRQSSDAGGRYLDRVPAFHRTAYKLSSCRLYTGCRWVDLQITPPAHPASGYPPRF